MKCVPVLMRQFPSGGERGYVDTQAHQVASMIDKVLRIRHSIALNVRTSWILRIRPPVVSFGKEIVPASGAARRMRSGNGNWLFFQILVCCLKNSVSIEGIDVD